VILTDSTDAYVPNEWRHLGHIHVFRCNPLVIESWAGFVADLVIACIRPDTANNAQVREVLRGLGARVYVLVEDNS
jgi:hypothetical protein